MQRKKKNIKDLLPIIIPVIVAVIVAVALAVSGNITQKKDEVTPTAQATTQATSETTQPVSEDAKVNIVAVGDNLIHNTLIDSGKQDDGSLNYDAFYSNISSYIKEADIAIINQETRLGGSSFDYSGYPMFNSPWEIGTAAINAGFNVFTCATNHSLDVSKNEGINKELEFFANHPEVTHTGTYSSEDEYNKITYLEKNGITFALLNYTYGTNGISMPDDAPWCLNVLSEEKVTSDVTQARENADVVIVFPHWGTEYNFDVSEEQEKYTKLFSDLGVDIVIGTHPHVIEPVEWVTNEETGKKMLVYYSLGNFISHQSEPYQLLGGMAEITVERINGEISITTAKMAPVVTYFKSTGSGYEFTVYKLSDYTEDIANTHAKSGATPSYFTDLAKEVVDEEFLDLE